MHEIIYDITGKKAIGSINFKEGFLGSVPVEDVAIVPDLVMEDGEWKVAKWRLVQRTQVETRPMSELMAAHQQAKE